MPMRTREHGPHSDKPSTAAATPCPVCDGTPRVLVAIRHQAMRSYTRELLQREYGCWVATEADTGQLAEAIVRHQPDLIVADTGDFPACCRRALEEFPRERVLVIGPEPDSAYRHAALAQGAGAWISRDRVGEELGPEMRRMLGCIHDPCPPGERPVHIDGVHGDSHSSAVT